MKTKRILSAVLSLVMILTAFPLTAVNSFAEVDEYGNGKCGDFYYYVISEDDKTCGIGRYTGSATKLEIPSTLDGYSVTSIQDWVFWGCTSLESVTMPDSVTSIGQSAFEDCTSLENINITDNIIYIGPYAFYGTKYYNNKSNWENGTLYIGNYLLCSDYGTVIEGDYFTTNIPSDYIVKDGTICISDYAFAFVLPNDFPDENDILKNITIPDSVTRIGTWAFYNCTSLTSVKIPESVIDIGDEAFGYYFKREGCKTERNEDFTIYGYEGTEAERYAKENGFKFIALNKESNILGDLDGDNEVAIKDAKWVLQSVANTRNLTAEQKLAADVNGDGDVTIVDAKWILQAVAGIRDLSKK